MRSRITFARTAQVITTHSTRFIDYAMLISPGVSCLQAFQQSINLTCLFCICCEMWCLGPASAPGPPVTKTFKVVVMVGNNVKGFRYCRYPGIPQNRSSGLIAVAPKCQSIEILHLLCSSMLRSKLLRGLQGLVLKTLFSFHGL